MPQPAVLLAPYAHKRITCCFGMTFAFISLRPPSLWCITLVSASKHNLSYIYIAPSRRCRAYFITNPSPFLVPSPSAYPNPNPVPSPLSSSYYPHICQLPPRHVLFIPTLHVGVLTLRVINRTSHKDRHQVIRPYKSSLISHWCLGPNLSVTPHTVANIST